MFKLAGVLLVLLLTYHLSAHAKVAPSIITRGEGLPSDDCHSQRTLFNIIWGCVSTTIICAWAAIHPNIPPREGPFKAALRRLELMFWTIVVPEILPCWALNQRLAAMTVRDVYNNAKGYEKKRRSGIWKTVKGWFSLYEIKEVASPAWTVSHGHFLIMGGFRVVELPNAVDVPPTSALLDVKETDMEKGQDRLSANEAEPKLEQGRETILTLEMLQELVKDPEFKIQITEEEITNMSKGDAFSKIIFIMQSTWFILQCLGRRMQGLDLTQLELTTLALASLNGITFALWWDKPLGAQALVRVYMKRKLTDLEWKGRLGDSSWRSALILQRLTAIHNALCQSPGPGLIRLPLVVFVLLTLPIFTIVLALYATVADIVARSSSFSPTKTHVPTFYVPKHRYSYWYHVLLLLTLGSVFGAIHCFGWNFPFPTHSRQTLWRVASLGVAILPIASLPFAFIVDSIIKHRLSNLQPMHNITLRLGFCIITAPHAVARFVLLGLALAHLWDLPPAAFIAIDWTKFYPHIL